MTSRRARLTPGIASGHVDDDAAAGISRLAEADGQYGSWNPEVFNGPGQCERVWWNNAHIVLYIDEARGIESFRVDDGRVDIRENLEFIRAAYVISVARRAVRNDATTLVLANLSWLEWLDHAVVGRHVPNPSIRLDAHLLYSMTIFGNLAL
jgi:hypothetical protein